MTKEEKIAQITDLLNITGNTTKLFRLNLIESLPNLDEAAIDKILEIIES